MYSNTGLVRPNDDDATTTARQKLRTATGILLDWDGCVALNDTPHRGGLTFLRRFRSRIIILSNNSTLWPEDIQNLLAKYGIDLPRERIILAGHQALVHAATLALPTLVFGSPHMRALARAMGIDQVTRNPQLVVLLRDTRFSYSRLVLGSNALLAGAKMIVANPDLTHPSATGGIVPETGALLASFTACVPQIHQNSIQMIGKPFSYLFDIACHSLAIKHCDAVMIGDNPTTDIEGASRLFMPSILVRPGSSLSLEDLC